MKIVELHLYGVSAVRDESLNGGVDFRWDGERKRPG
jgi:hypothetical protein